MTAESDAELAQRYAHVKGLLEQAQEQAERMKPGGPRDRASRWAGSLRFILLHLEREVRERGIGARTPENEDE